MTSPAGAKTGQDGKRVYVVQGQELPSVSTVLNVLDKPGLNTWKLKNVAHAVTQDAEVYELATHEGTLWPAVKTALDRIPRTAADLGTAVHDWTERYDKGEDITGCPLEIRPYLERWMEARDEWGIIPVSIERTVANPDVGYAGTYDRIVTMDGGVWTCGQFCEHPNHTLDVKTGRDVWPDVALQLAAYTYAPWLWDPETDTVEPRIPTCRQHGLVAAVHADEPVRIFPVYLLDAWAAVRASTDVFAFDKIKGHVLGKALPRKTTELPW